MSEGTILNQRVGGKIILKKRKDPSLKWIAGIIGFTLVLIAITFLAR